MAYSKETYKKAEQELAQRRSRALAERENHHRIAVETVPEILEAEEKMSRAGLATIKAVGMGAADAKEYIQKLSEINLEAQAQRRLLLKSNGFPEDWLDVHYTCKKCEDKGFVSGIMCGCFKELLKSIEYEKLCSKLPVGNCRFDNFKLDYYPDGAGTSPKKRMESVLNYCKAYAADFSRRSPSLLLYGKTGLGKTHLSLAIAGNAVEEGYGVIYSSAQNLFNKLEKDKFGKADANTEEAILDCDLLIIDDLGAEFTTQFTVSALYNIVNSRELESKPTIISTNLMPEQLTKAYGERIASRILSNYVMLYFDGSDIRQIKTR
ncbi:MAG: ATP-binding protein [Oscillospiraceae bacterium]|nr:ATP-binding protein [Clostridiaceae bacterium]MDY5890174.1 ATP-binding protein [Oscillospiraceae bacterium]MDY5934613.1 ATP-binding protein [Oscillospiraceae bacterium]